MCYTISINIKDKGIIKKMLINETKFDADALKALSTQIKTKSQLYIALLYVLVAVVGVLLIVFGGDSALMQWFGAILVLSAVIAFISTIFGWGRFTSKQIEKIASKQLKDDIIERYEIDDDAEKISIVINVNGNSLKRQNVDIKDLYKVVASDDYLFLFLNAEHSLVMKKSSMIEGEAWEVELTLRKVLGDKYIDKRSVKAN